MFIFTDGSCRQNPGPCEAGICVFLPGREECVELKKPVSRLVSVLLGELVATEIALAFIEGEVRKKQINRKCEDFLRLSISSGTSYIRLDSIIISGNNQPN